MLLPKDPYILLSFLNARLRDQYADLELSLIHISSPRDKRQSRMPSSA